MRPLNRVILHSTATPEGRDVTVDTIRQWHIDRGWRDIGYHYVIYRNGQIKLGRPLAEQGAHAKGHNEDSIGVVYVGGTDKSGNAKDTRTLAQKISQRLLLVYFRIRYQITEVIGHKDCGSTECPSFDVAEFNRRRRYDLFIVILIIAVILLRIIKSKLMS